MSRREDYRALSPETGDSWEGWALVWLCRGSLPSSLPRLLPPELSPAGCGHKGLESHEDACVGGRAAGWTEVWPEASCSALSTRASPGVSLADLPSHRRGLSRPLPSPVSPTWRSEGSCQAVS